MPLRGRTSVCHWGEILETSYRVLPADADIDSIAVMVATVQGEPTALVGVHTVDISAYLGGPLSEADFVRRWVVQDY